MHAETKGTLSLDLEVEPSSGELSPVSTDGQGDRLDIMIAEKRQRKQQSLAKRKQLQHARRQSAEAKRIHGLTKQMLEQSRFRAEKAAEGDSTALSGQAEGGGRGGVKQGW